MNADSLTPAQLNELRGQLEIRKRALEEQIAAGSDSTQPVELDQQSVGRVSRIDAIQQQQMALAGRAQAERLLQGVELALARSEDGGFGQCRQCDEPIAFARLQAQPWATLCIACQAANEER